MKIETAIKILNKEREFLGMGFLNLLFDIQKEQSTFPGMVYSPKVIEAYNRFMVDGQKMFEPVAEKQQDPISAWHSCQFWYTPSIDWESKKMIKFINDHFDTVILPILFALGTVVIVLDLFYWRAVWARWATF